MAFTGTPVLQQISDRAVRITGVSLGNGAAGTIGLAGGSGEISLPAAFKPTVYGQYGTVDLAESIEISVWAAGATLGAGVQIAKTASPFLATITNNAAGAATAALEIYVKWH
jgi:hypothetical protein